MGSTIYENEPVYVVRARHRDNKSDVADTIFITQSDYSLAAVLSKNYATYFKKYQDYWLFHRKDGFSNGIIYSDSSTYMPYQSYDFCLVLSVDFQTKEDTSKKYTPKYYLLRDIKDMPEKQERLTERNSPIWKQHEIYLKEERKNLILRRKALLNGIK